MTRFQKKLWIGLIIMALLSPVGLIVPEKFNAGEAWGEWGTAALEKLIGYVPEGLRQYADFWKAPIADYRLGGEDASTGLQALWYIISGLLGMVAVTLVVYGISKFLIKHEK